MIWDGCGAASASPWRRRLCGVQRRPEFLHLHVVTGCGRHLVDLWVALTGTYGETMGQCGIRKTKLNFWDESRSVLSILNGWGEWSIKIHVPAFWREKQRAGIWPTPLSKLNCPTFCLEVTHFCCSTSSKQRWLPDCRLVESSTINKAALIHSNDFQCHTQRWL